MEKTRDVSDEKQVKKASEKDARENMKKDNSVRYVLATKEGRKFYWDLMCDCGIFVISAHASGSWTYYNEGKRSVGLKLLSNLNDLDPTVYATMVTENKGE